MRYLPHTSPNELVGVLIRRGEYRLLCAASQMHSKDAGDLERR